MTTSTIAPSTIKTDSIVARLIERHGAAEEQRTQAQRCHARHGAIG